VALLVVHVGCQRASADVTRDTLLGQFVAVVLRNPTSKTLHFEIFGETSRVAAGSWTQGPNSTSPTIALAITILGSYSFRIWLT
jgi:hypothetical protein